MWLILQQDVPDVYVITTSESRSVGEFLEGAFSLVGIDWREHGRSTLVTFIPRRLTGS